MKLGKGINYSRYCWQWRGTAAKDYNDYMDGSNGTDLISPPKLQEARNHVALIKQLGFDTIRLPITFHCWSAFNNDRIDPNHPYWAVLDNMIAACQINNLKLVISYHHAPTINPARVMAMWQQIAQRPKVLHTSENILFEIFNEPENNISNAVFRTNAIQIINAIRAIPQHANRWMVVGGNWWNDIGFDDNGLTGLVPLPVPNLVYTFHSYEPKVFTNQGAKNEACFQTTGMSFPFKLPLAPFVASGGCATDENGFNEGKWKYDNYDKDAGNGTGVGMGTDDFLRIRIAEAKRWSVQHGNLPVWCGEWGFHRHIPTIPDDGSIQRFAKAMLSNFEANAIDWCWWDFEGPFTPFNPVPDVITVDDTFGITPCTNDSFDSSLAGAMKLDKRIGIRLNFLFNPTAPKTVIVITCGNDVSNLKDMVFRYEYEGKRGNVMFRMVGARSIAIAKQTRFTISKSILSFSLTVNHLDGSVFTVNR